MDHWLNTFELHDLLHCCRNGCSTSTAGIEAKLVQQLTHLEQVPIYRVFFNLRKAFNAMDMERYILILEVFGVRPRMIRLIQNFWQDAVLICRASGKYRTPFWAGHGITQGEPLSAKLFDILVDAVRKGLGVAYGRRVS